MGDFDHEKPTHLQILSMVRLIDHAIREFDIPLDPDIPVFRECQNCTNYTEAVRRPWLIGHHHAGNTSCPGEYLEGWIEPLRQYFEQSHSH